MRSHPRSGSLFLGLAASATLILVAGSPLLAGEEIAEREGLECAVCHVDGEEDMVLLTDRGKYYQLMGDLESFDLVLERFGECTYCHVQEAGSRALTREGRRFEWMMEDMVGLRAWLEEMHPRPAEETSEGASARDGG